MTKKATPNSLNYSWNSPLGFLNIKPPLNKPRMLSIAAVPDGNTVVVHHVDKGGVKFDSTGNFELPPYEEIEREELVLGGKKPKAPHFSRPDFAVNRICDPDANKNGLELAQQIVEEYGIPVINHPARILATRRDILYQRFANREGIVVPKTIRITPRYCRDVEAILEQGEISLPCIFRPAGGHNSRGVTLIKEPGDASELECFAFDGRDYYISELYDCRDSDGLYRKFRVIYVDGKLYPRHLFVSDAWCVDGKTKFTEEKYLNEEKHFLENFQSCLGNEVIAKLTRFCSEIGLDFFGLDLNLRPDGTVVVFEANACMAVFLSPKREYLEPFVNNIQTATKEMLLRFHQSIQKGS